MGHVALPILQQLVKNEMVAGIRVKGEPDEVLGCPTCIQAKFTRYPFSSSEATAKAPLDEVVMDVVAPLKLGASGAEYFLNIVDVYTRMTWVYVLSKKSDMAETVKTDWLLMVERQQDRLVKANHTDRGGEFISKEFSLWLKKNGIRHSLNMPYSPAMNGITERANRTITETARRLLIEAGPPDYFWPDAVQSACVAKNRALNHVGADKWVPYVEWIGRKPKVDMLRVFGCMCMALVPKHLRHNKLGAKAIWVVHLGMAQNSKGWLLWDPFTKKFLVSRDCKFMENLMYKDWKAENEAKIGVRLGNMKSSGLEHVELPLELSSTSTTTRQSSLVNGGEEAKDAEEEEEEVQQVSEPTLKKALEGSDAEEWKKAMESELKSIEENGTWELVELPEGRKAITSKWLFKIKSDADGKIERYKSRLVAKGYQQKEKVDYKELFAPVVKPTTLRTLLAGAAIKGWVVKQMDVTTAFLNGVLEEEIFMAQPEGFDDGSGRVLRLKKAPRQWYLKLRGVLEEIGFTPSSADHSLFMIGEGEERSFMVVYVDDILIFSPSSDLVKEVMLKLQDKFKCKALGDVSFYLGLHIERDVEKRCMWVHQRKYLEALAANVGQSEGHVATPFPSGFKCVKGPEEESVGEEERRRFHSLVGSLMYAAVNTRPDVAFATGQLTRVVQCPNEEQVAVGRRVAQYLGQTPTVGLQYSAAAQRRHKGADSVEPGRLFLTAFSDASFASEPEDMTSVGGFICCVGGGPTAWESKKQVDQALSSVESEYMALFRAVREIVWQRRLLAELGEEQQGPTPLYCDSQGAIALAKNHVLHGLTKHMRVKWHWTRSMVAAGEVELLYVKTTGQPADMMTKRLLEQQHWKFRLELRERFGQDLPVLRQHNDRGGEFSSNPLRDFCRGEGILQSFMFPDSPQQNGIAERRIGLVMEVARTSMIHVAAPHFLWPFAVWGSRAFVRDTSMDKLSPRAIPCVFLSFVPDAHGWQFYHPTSRRVFPSQDVTFDELVPFYRLFPYRSAPPLPLPLFLAPGPTPVDPLPPQGPALSGVSQVDPLPGLAPVQVAVGSGAARGAASGGAEPGGAESEGAETGGEPRGAEPEGVEPGGAASEGVKFGCADPQGAALSGATGAGGAGAAGAGRIGGTGAGGAGVVDPGGAVRSRPYFVPLLQQCQPPLQPASPMPAPSPYTEQSGGHIERRAPTSRPVSPVRTASRVRRSRPPPVLGMHAMTLQPSSILVRVPLPAPPKSSLPKVPVPESDRARAASPTVSCLLATAVKDPSFESAATFALVVELLDFAVACRLDYTTALMLSLRLPVLRPSGGDPDAPDIPTPRSYAQAITGTYVDEVPPPGANIVNGMWIFKVKRPPGSPLAFKARYVARGFSQRQGVDYFQTFSPTLKMTTLRVLLHVTAQRDYELHSLEFSTTFLQGSLHEEIWLRRPPGFTESFTAEPSGLFPELVGCLMYLMTCTRPDLAYPLSLMARYVALSRHRKVHWDAAKRVLCYLCNTSGMGLVLGGRGPVVLTGHADASWVDDSGTQRSSQGYTFSLGSGSIS
ncbi:unnamed protein product [Closterium sp. NIES-54]